MNCPKNWKDCKVCKEVAKPKNYTDDINWSDLGTIAVFLIIGFILGGFIGVIVAFACAYQLGHFQGGTNFYTPGKPRVEYRDCPLGHKNCLHTSKRAW